MKKLMWLFAATVLGACGPKAQTTPPPATASAPPAQQTAPAPQAPDRRPEVVSHLDAIDHELSEATEHKMINVSKHAEAIHTHVTALADPIATFPRASESYQELKTQAHKFVEASRKADHHDSHEHHGHLVELVKRVRADVAAQ